MIGRITSISALLLLVSSLILAQAPSPLKDCSPPNHAGWTQLLQRHVDSSGWVNYKGFVADSVKLNDYLAELSNCQPTSKWSKEEKLAFWINVYNAFTVKLIVDHYPVVSIKDIKRGIPFVNSVWELDFFEIGGKSFDLGTIEHQILRKHFDEPRIHFAIVCASRSCPRLLNEAYDPARLDQQLTIQARNFINDRTKNEINSDELQLSLIFKWFKKDFTRNGSLLEFLKVYSDNDFLSSASVKYQEYDWSLNGE